MKARKKSKECDSEIIRGSSAVINIENTVLYAKMARTQETKGVFDALKDALKTTTIKFIKPFPDNPDSGGFSITAFDKRTRSLIKVKIPTSTFSEYHIVPDEGTNEISVGINVKLFTTLLKQANNTDVMTWYVDKEERDKFAFVFENRKKNLVNIKKLRLFNLQAENFKIPTTEFVCKLSILSEDFHKYVKDSSVTSNKMEISFIDTAQTKNTIIFAADGVASAECILTDKTDGVTIVKTNDENVDTVVRGKYELKNLCTFAKCQPFCSHVELFLKEDYPLIIKYDIDEYGFIYLILPSDETTVVDDDDEDDEDEDDEDHKEYKAGLKRTENAEEAYYNEMDDEEDEEEEPDEDD